MPRRFCRRASDCRLQTANCKLQEKGCGEGWKRKIVVEDEWSGHATKAEGSADRPARTLVA